MAPAAGATGHGCAAGQGVANPAQAARIGDQTGGRVGFFLHTDDFARDHAAMIANGVKFVREPKREAYGVVAVWRDLYGNLWDLIRAGAVMRADTLRYPRRRLSFSDDTQ